jgi:hypothetical protein
MHKNKKTQPSVTASELNRRQSTNESIKKLSYLCFDC